MLNGIDHVAVAVPSIEKVLPLYRDLLGFELEKVEDVPQQDVRVAVLTCGAHRLELVEPSREDSPVTRFLERRGGGLHHVCLAVDGLEGVLEVLADAGVKLIDERPVQGAEGCRVAFVHPHSTGGVLIELSERPGPDPA